MNHLHTYIDLQANHARAQDTMDFSWGKPGGQGSQWSQGALSLLLPIRDLAGYEPGAPITQRAWLVAFEVLE